MHGPFLDPLSHGLEAYGSPQPGLPVELLKDRSLPVLIAGHVKAGQQNRYPLIAPQHNIPLDVQRVLHVFMVIGRHRTLIFAEARMPKKHFQAQTKGGFRGKYRLHPPMPTSYFGHPPCMCVQVSQCNLAPSLMDVNLRLALPLIYRYIPRDTWGRVSVVYTTEHTAAELRVSYGR